MVLSDNTDNYYKYKYKYYRSNIALGGYFQQNDRSLCKI